MLTHLLGDAPYEDEVQWVEDECLEIDLDGGVLREHHGKENQSWQSGKYEQGCVNPPEILLSAPFHEAEQEDNRQDACRCHERSDDVGYGGSCLRVCAVAFRHHNFLWRNEVGDAVYQFDVSWLLWIDIRRRHLLLRGVLACFHLEVHGQVVGQKLPFPLVDRKVGTVAQEQVVAEACPTVMGVQAVNLLTIGGECRFDLEVGAVGCQVVDDHVACTCGAVVVEEVVAVGAVLLAVVLLYGSKDVPFLVSCQGKALLSNPSAFVGILRHETFHGDDAYLIVGEPEDEAQHKKVLVEGEHAPVDSHIAAMGTVFYAKSGVSIIRPNLLSRSAGQE